MFKFDTSPKPITASIGGVTFTIGDRVQCKGWLSSVTPCPVMRICGFTHNIGEEGYIIYAYTTWREEEGYLFFRQGMYLITDLLLVPKKFDVGDTVKLNFTRTNPIDETFTVDYADYSGNITVRDSIDNVLKNKNEKDYFLYKKGSAPKKGCNAVTDTINYDLDYGYFTKNEGVEHKIIKYNDSEFWDLRCKYMDDMPARWASEFMRDVNEGAILDETSVANWFASAMSNTVQAAAKAVKEQKEKLEEQEAILAARFKERDVKYRSLIDAIAQDNTAVLAILTLGAAAAIAGYFLVFGSK